MRCAHTASSCRPLSLSAIRVRIYLLSQHSPHSIDFFYHNRDTKQTPMHCSQRHPLDNYIQMYKGYLELLETCHLRDMNMAAFTKNMTEQYVKKLFNYLLELRRNNVQLEDEKKRIYTAFLIPEKYEKNIYKVCGKTTKIKKGIGMADVAPVLWSISVFRTVYLKVKKW